MPIVLLTNVEQIQQPRASRHRLPKRPRAPSDLTSEGVVRPQQLFELLLSSERRFGLQSMKPTTVQQLRRRVSQVWRSVQRYFFSYQGFHKAQLLQTSKRSPQRRRENTG